MNGRDQGGVENGDAEEVHGKVTFHPSVVPSASDLHVDKVYYPEFHYDEFRGLYYVNARDVGIKPAEEAVIEQKSDPVPIMDPPHEELEFHFDEDRKKWYYEADDLVSEDESDDQCSDETIPAEDQPIKYPDAYRPSQAFIDKINSSKLKPVHYDEERDLYYTLCDDEDDGLIPLEEAVVGPVTDLKSDAASVTNHGVFSPKVNPSKQDDKEQKLTLSMK